MNNLKQHDIPTSKGVYCYLDEKAKSIQYVGSAVGQKDCAEESGAALKFKLSRNQKSKIHKKRLCPTRGKITLNGEIAIKKSAFRKNLARQKDLAPGQQCLTFLKENFQLVFFSLEDINKEEIHKIEKEIINSIEPKYNLRKF